MLGLDAFQEADVFNLTMPVTKHNYLVMETNDIPATVTEAFAIATSGRPGPVLIDIPKDVSAAPFSGTLQTTTTIKFDTPRIAKAEVKRVATLLKKTPSDQ